MNPSAAVRVFAALLLVAGIGVFVILSRSEPPDTPRSPRPSAPQSTRVEPTEAPITPPVATSGADRPAPEPSGASDIGTTAPQPSPQEEEIRAIRVEVVDPDGSPLVGILVALRVSAPTISHLSHALSAAESEEPNGIASIELPDDWLESPANRSADLQMHVACEIPMDDPVRVALPTSPWPPTEPVRLVVPANALAWTQPIRVLVVDSEGAPLPSVTVDIQTVRANEPGQKQDVASAKTDRDGIATLERDRLAKQLSRAGMIDVGFEVYAVLDHPLVDPPRKRLHDLIDLPDPIRLVMPPTGSLVAEVVDSAGIAATNTEVGIAYRRAGSDTSFTGWKNYIDATDGTARLDGIGTGLELSVTAWPSDGKAKAGTARTTGPEYAGHEVHVALRTGPTYPTILGRVVGRDGRPVASEKIDASLRLMRAVPRDSSARVDQPARIKLVTGPDGRFRHTLHGRVADGDHRVLTVTPKGTNDFCCVALPDPIPAGVEVDLGDLVLREIPVLLSGRVVDVNGNPLKGAVLQVSGTLPGQSRSERLTISDRTTDRDGTFEIRYANPPVRVDLYVNERSRRFAQLDGLAAGTTGLEITAKEMEPKTDVGIVEGSVLFDRGISFDHLEVALEVGGGREKTQVAGIFRFKNVPAGTHALVVRTDPGDLVIRRLEDIVVVAGQTCNDPRLAEIDVRTAVRYLRIRLVHDDGRPVASARFWIRAADAGYTSSGSAMTDANGRYVVLVPTENASFILKANEYAPLEVPFSDGGYDTVVTPR